MQSNILLLGTIASFNFDTSASSVATTQYHLTDQNYDICIRRARGYCSVCYDPNIVGPSTSTTSGTSFGLTASGDPAAQKSAVGTTCTGITTITPTVANQKGFGDYLEIAALQPGTGTSTTVAGTNRICGAVFNANPTVSASSATACSYSVPFRVGVHMDDAEAITAPPAVGANYHLAENTKILAGSGQGYFGFYLNYWQNSC